MLRQTLHKYSDELYILSQTFTNSLSQSLSDRFTSSLRFNFIQIWRITLHIFIELFLRNDLIKFIQTLQTFNKLDIDLQHIFNNSSTHLQHNTLFLRIDLANYSNTSLNVDLHRNIYFNNLWTISSRQFHHDNFITTISSQLMNHNLWTIRQHIFINFIARFISTNSSS